MKTKPSVLFLGFLFSTLSLSAAQPWHTAGKRSECLLFERHTWNAQDAVDETPGYSRRCYTYTDSVFIPASLAGKCFTLSCGAANQEAWLSINGDTVGYHAGGYTAFAFDVTPLLPYGTVIEAATMAQKFSPRIRVNAIVPGFLITNQNRALLTNSDGSLTARGEDVIRHTPAGRFAEPKELCGTIHYLISEASSFVTGALSVVDGGFDVYSI